MSYIQIIREWLRQCKMRLQVVGCQLSVARAALVSKMRMLLR
jgi:hypothetical protein